ncbi:terminase TerL endonuclease subunit, partial [Priestia megaterium]
YDTVKNMIETNPTLKKHCRIIDSKKKITRKATNSFLQVLSSDASKADGYNGHIICLDETHEAKNGDLYSKLKTSMGTRTQPLMLTITTASNGQDEFNLEYRTYLYAQKVASGDVDDPTFYSAIYQADDDCDVTDESQWYKSNPALGIFRNYDELKSLAYRAKAMPQEEAKFRRLYLNQHIILSTEQGINMNKWKMCGEKSFDLDMLKGRECWAGLDLASTKDLSAFVMVFPIEDQYYVVPHFFKPSDDLIAAQNRDGFDYLAHSKAGHLHATKGDHISFRYIRQIINECAKEYQIKDIAFDRLGSQGIVADLHEDGLYTVDFGQGFRQMSPAIEKFFDVLFEARLHHNNHPVLNWMAGNAMISENPAGDIKFDKKKSVKRIDGIVAMTMA